MVFFANKSWNTLPYYESIQLGAPVAARTRYTDSLLSGDTSFALGLMPRWQVGFAVANIFAQEVNTDGDDAVYGAFSKKGVNEYKLSTKVNFYKTPGFGAAIAASANFDQINDNPYTGSGAGPTMNLQLIGDTRVGNWNFSGNLGYRFRKKGTQTDPVIVPAGNDYLYSIGASYLFRSTNTKLILEYFASEPAQKTEGIETKALANREFLIGLKQDFTANVAGHFGFTKEASRGQHHQT